MLLFACVENACRSQMAEGLAKELGDEIIATSGGSNPAEKINKNAAKVMEEKGIDISSQIPTSIKTEEAESADYVITMGCGPEACPAPVGNKIIEWDIEDPSGKSIEKFREVRDEIEEKVKELIKEVSENSEN